MVPLHCPSILKHDSYYSLIFTRSWWLMHISAFITKVCLIMLLHNGHAFFSKRHGEGKTGEGRTWEGGPGGENRGPGCGESVVGHVYEMEWQVQCHAMVFRSAAAGTRRGGQQPSYDHSDSTPPPYVCYYSLQAVMTMCSCVVLIITSCGATRTCTTVHCMCWDDQMQPILIFVVISDPGYFYSHTLSVPALLAQ